MSANIRKGYYSEQTRDAAFELLLNDIPGRKEKAIKVFNALKYGSQTSHQISKSINYPVHLVCARLNELRDMGLVIDIDSVMNDETGAPNRIWDIDSSKLNEQKEIEF
ncbi:MAG: hypothetical protein J0M18_19415 [Ignavibacteria bacterium]|nr:hypothetical protein [Ignavibacteria bacterium]